MTTPEDTQDHLLHLIVFLQEVVLGAVLLLRVMVRVVDLLQPRVHLVEVVDREPVQDQHSQEDLPELHNHQHLLSLIHQDMLVALDLGLQTIMLVVVQVQDKMEILEHQHPQIKVVKVVMEYKIVF
tara:strand:- start:38 stop:415 length:378 start_codon:yes stop_codon:yes gene_type:complete